LGVARVSRCVLRLAPPLNMASKRARPSVSSGGHIDVDVGGQLFRTSEATLRKASYFAALLSSNWRNDCTEEVIFVDRDPELFQRVLSFMRSGSLAGIPSFAAAPDLWRALREEANFFGVSELCAALHETHRCTFQHTGDGNGVLAWIGHNKGRRDTYVNPHTAGSVLVFSSVHDLAPHDPATGNRRQPPVNECELDMMLTDWIEHDDAHKDFVAFERDYILCRIRPHIPGGAVRRVDWTCSCEASDGRWCSINGRSDLVYIAVDLRSIFLRPTAYTLCGATSCSAMRHWNFAASTDGITWDILHKARNESGLHATRVGDEHMSIVAGLADAAEDLSQLSEDTQSSLRQVAKRLSLSCRKTFPLSPVPSTYYRYFRVSNISLEDWAAVRDADDPSDCMHFGGLELYGSVHEE